MGIATPVDPRHLHDSIEKAVGFLKEQLAAGRYSLSCVGSDGTPRFSDNKGHVFTAFFVVEALADRLSELERTIVLIRILSEENHGCWGFSPPAPYIGPEHEAFIVDADDTAYVLRTLRRLGINRQPSSLLRFHRPDVNGFVTFNTREAARISTTPSHTDNMLIHPEVNANVFKALSGTNFGQYINYELVRDTQASEGYWPSFFYPSRFFATHLALDVIHQRQESAENEKRGLRFLLDAQNRDGSWGEPGNAYETALAGHALAVCGQFGDSLSRAVTYLVATMTPRGSWQADRCIWQFHADPHDIWKAYDTHETFVSALCTMVLRRARAA